MHDKLISFACWEELVQPPSKRQPGRVAGLSLWKINNLEQNAKVGRIEQIFQEKYRLCRDAIRKTQNDKDELCERRFGLKKSEYWYVY